jgi:putative ABC transport system permease protein
MWRVTIKNLLAHKLRLALTALAIVMGVGFVSGTFVLGDTVKHTFNTLFRNASSNKDAVVTGKPAFTSSGFQSETNEPVPDSTLAKVEQTPGVAHAEGTVGSVGVYVLDKEGKEIKTGFAPHIGTSASQDPSLSSLEYVKGRAPTEDGEVAIDKNTADKAGWKVGDRVTAIAKAPAQYTLVGIATFGSAENPGGASLTIFDLATAQRVMGKEGIYDSIEVRATKGTTPNDVVAALQESLGPQFKVQTGTAAGQETADQINKGLSQFTTAISIFGFIALFVGSFIIVNTFSILVAQRNRELALLRALGASRRQVSRSVLGEAFVTGVIASVIGVGVGILIALGLKGLLNSFGSSLPPGPTVYKPTSFIIPIALGVVITCGAAYLPARRAAKVPPIAAMRESVPTSEEGLLKRIIAGAIALALGVVILAAGLFADAGLALVGLGALLSFVGVTMLVPLVARPVSRALGTPLAKWGPAGRLGQENAMRNPRRTSSTAAALLVGLALVGTVTTLGASLKASFDRVIDKSIRADFVLGGDNTVISPEVAVAIAKDPSIEAVAALRNGIMQINGATKNVSGINSDGTSLVNLEMKEGSIDALARGELLIDENVADNNHLTVGQELPVVFPRTGPTTLEVGGIYKVNPLPGGYLIANDVLAGKTSQDNDVGVLVKAKPGELAAAKAAVTAIAKPYPNVTVKDQTTFKRDQKKQIDQLLNIVIVLLALSVVIAVIGIVNTLALSVFERTREIGLLRAVGMQRKQVKRMIRSEAVIVALLGSVIGLIVGVTLASVLVAALASGGIDQFSVPVPRLIFYLVVAGAFGVLAAVFPARRANKLDVLSAITTE